MPPEVGILESNAILGDELKAQHYERDPDLETASFRKCKQACVKHIVPSSLLFFLISGSASLG